MPAMGRLLCALAIAAALPLSGCVALTSLSDTVSQTSARLEASGHSDDSPAHFYFRYADDKADLGTAAGHKTPQRSVPAHVPEDGHDLGFGENVTGLSPGRLYWYDVCGGDSAMSPDLCSNKSHVFTLPTATQDSIQGYFRDSEYGHFVEVDAASGPQGQNADGWFHSEIRYFGTASMGQVTCLAVNGSRAAVGVVGTAYTGDYNKDPHPYSAVWTLDSLNQTFHEAVTQSAPNCAAASFDQQAASFAWGIDLNDAN